MENGKKIGYARVSTCEQNFDLQLDALKAAGCNQIFTDQGISGATIERDGLNQALEVAGEGDTRVVWTLVERDGLSPWVYRRLHRHMAARRGRRGSSI